jgi:hypothetical protein
LSAEGGENESLAPGSDEDEGLVDGPRSHPRHELVVMAVQDRHRKGRVAALEPGQQRGQNRG